MKRNPRTIEQLESRYLMASDWQNHSLICDVDRSGMVTVVDALVLVNRLNEMSENTLPARLSESSEPLLDVDGDGDCTPLDLLQVINAINQFGNIDLALVGGLSPDSDPNNDGIVLADQVQFDGQTLAQSSVVVAIDGEAASRQTVLADVQGRFRVNLRLNEGVQSVFVESTDILGRAVNKRFDIRRGNVIQDFDAAALDVVRQWTTLSNDPYTNRVVTAQPPLVARNLAMIHAAMFDAANAVSGTYQGYAFNTTSQPRASEVAAAASAGFEVAKVLYHDVDEVAVWQSSLDEALATVRDITARGLGIELGKQAASAILNARANDGASDKPSYIPSEAVGHWQRTFPDYLPPLLAQWPMVKPFVMTSTNEFRPPAPPTLDSPEYATAVDQVMRWGGFQSADRTADQTEIALFWADGGGTATPPGHWNRITSDVTLAKHSSLLETARTFALVDLAMADAGVAAWDAKYYYDLWRPIDAIRKASVDNNPLTTAVATWIPLLKSPPFPTYTSGHSTFSASAATVLASLFGDQTSFDSVSDGHSAPEERPIDVSQITTRHFTSFSQAATEAGMSRIYGGIHFSFDNQAGLELGNRIGSAIMDRAMPIIYE